MSGHIIAPISLSAKIRIEPQKNHLFGRISECQRKHAHEAETIDQTERVFEMINTRIMSFILAAVVAAGSAAGVSAAAADAGTQSGVIPEIISQQEMQNLSEADAAAFNQIAFNGELPPERPDGEFQSGQTPPELPDGEFQDGQTPPAFSNGQFTGGENAPGF